MLLIYMLTGFTISLITVPFFTSLAVKAHIVDVPCERKIHIDNTPLLGGLGIFLAYIIITLMLDSFSTKIYALIAANIAIITTGILDDVIHLNAPKKLFGQIIAATIIVVFTDFRFTISTFDFEILSNPIFNIFFTYLWIVGVTNAINLIDGMDGLAGGIAFMAFGAIGYAAYTKGFELNAYICMGLMGATLGFLRYNIPPAKVFMGDTGSLFLGFNIAIMSIAASHKSGTVLSVLVPVMFISLPLFDTFLAIVRRTLKGQNPMTADREHLHHRLLSLEFSSVQTLMIFYTLSIVLMAISILSFQKHYIWGTIIVFLLLYAFFLTLKLFHLYDAGTKIRTLNEKMRESAIAVSKRHKHQNIRTRYIDIIVAITSFTLLAKFIWSEANATFTHLYLSITFIITLLVIMTYRKLSHIKNEFTSFAFFWVFFYIIFNSYNSSFGQFEMISIGILSLCIFLKIIVNKQFDLFISNPMELVIVFSLMLIYLVTKAPLEQFFFISLYSLILYYSNKVFYTHTCPLNTGYSVAILTFVLIFSLTSSLLLLSNRDTGVIAFYTPSQVKTALKKDIDAEDYLAGRKKLLDYEVKKPFHFMKSTYKSEGAKIYYFLMIDSLFKGDLIVSDFYLKEFLTLFPDLVDEFYAMVKPVLTGINKLEMSGAGNVKIHGTPLTDIVEVYASTLSDFSTMYVEKGYDKRSKAYREVAHLLQKIVDKTS